MPQRGEKQREREWGCSGTDILPTERKEERQWPKRGKKPNPSSSFFLFRLLLRRAARAPDEPLGLSRVFSFILLFFRFFSLIFQSNSELGETWKMEKRLKRILVRRNQCPIRLDTSSKRALLLIFFFFLCHEHSHTNTRKYLKNSFQLEKKGKKRRKNRENEWKNCVW